MEHIIQQIAQELVEKIMGRAYSGKISDIDALTEEVLGDCKASAARVIEAILAEMNQQIREDKQMRKERGLVMKEKDRPRSLFTKLGMLHFYRDYYYDRHHRKHICIMDAMTGVTAYDRITGGVSAEMVSLATEMSYAKSAQIATCGTVSRQSVRNKILELGSLEKKVDLDEEKRIVKELHVFADEDHVHMQKPNKVKGKKSVSVPLVTVTEGIRSKSGRRETISPMHFVDEGFDTKRIWESVEGYIGSAYDLEALEMIYLHADGGSWIVNGLENFAQKKMVMDGYHFEKKLKMLANQFPKKNVQQRIRKALKEDDRKKADRILQSLCSASDEDEMKKVSEFGTYLMGHWEAIRMRVSEELPGSCTEGQVSHILSERFSRDPLGWSREGLGKLSKQRVYLKNNGKITASDFKRKKESESDTETYSEYARRLLSRSCEKKLDWSLFDKREPIFDVASGTQILLHKTSMLHNAIRN